MAREKYADSDSDTDSGCGSLSSVPPSISKQEAIKLCIEKNQEIINSIENQFPLSSENEDSSYIKENMLFVYNIKKQLSEKNEMFNKELEALNTLQQSVQSLSSLKKKTLVEQTLPPPPPPPPPPPQDLKKMKNNRTQISFRNKMEDYIDKIVKFKIFLKGKIEPFVDEKEKYTNLESILTNLVDSFEDIKKIHLESQKEEILKEVYDIFSKQIPIKLQLENNFTCGTISEQLQEKDKFIIVYFENINSLLGDLINKSKQIENKNEKLIKIIENMQTNVQVLLREIKEKQSKDPQDSIFLEIMKCFVKHLQRVNLSHAENIIISRSRINKIQQNSVRKHDTPSQEIIEQPIIFKLNQMLRIPPKLLPKPKTMDESSSEDIRSQKNVFEQWGLLLKSKKPEDSKDQEDLEGVSFKMKK